MNPVGKNVYATGFRPDLPARAGRLAPWPEHPDRSSAARIENADRYNHRDGNDDYRQPGDLFWLMTPEHKDQLFHNIKAAMEGVPVEIVKRQIVHFYKADPDYGIGVATRMGLSVADLPAAAAA